MQKMLILVIALNLNKFNANQITVKNKIKHLIKKLLLVVIKV